MLRARARTALGLAIVLSMPCLVTAAAGGAPPAHPAEPHAALLGPPTVPSTTPTVDGPANFRPGPRKVLVLLAQIAGQPAPGSADAIRSMMFTAPNSVNAFVQEETFGQISLTGRWRSDGDVFGPYLVTSKYSADQCDYAGWGSDAERQFKIQLATTDPAVDLDDWDEVVVIFQYPFSACAFTGAAEIGQLHGAGTARRAWINAVLTGGVPTTSVVAHEIGHNLGVDHAGGLICSQNGAAVSFTDACALSPPPAGEYLDPFDVMGTGAHEENAYHRWESGWLPSASVQTVVKSGTYLLAPVEQPSSTVQLIKVPRAGGEPDFWLDYRQPNGGWFDNFAPTDAAVNGVGVRLANASTMPHPSKSWLIDMHPATPTFGDAPLAPGETFSDASRGVSISTLSVSPAGALVRIVVPNGADTTPPAAPTGLSATASGSSLQLMWSASSDDSGPVQHYAVSRDGAPLGDVWGTSFTDQSPSAPGTSTYTITPLDPAGNVGPAATILVMDADTTAPSAPTGLTAGLTGSWVSLHWSPALDDVGVASYEVDRDGAVLAQGLTGTSYTDPGVAPGTHTYVVRASDAAGNVGAFSAAASVTLVVQAAVPPATVKKTVVKKVSAITLKRLGTHRVLVSWKAQKGATRYQVLRPSGKKTVLLATVRKAQWVDGHAARGTLSKKRYVVRAVIS